MNTSIWIKVTNTVTGVVQFFDISETPTFRAWPGAVFSLVDIDGFELDVQGLTISQRRRELVLKVDEEEVANFLNFYDPASRSSFQAISAGESLSTESSDDNTIAQRESRIETMPTLSNNDTTDDDEGMSTAMKIGIGLGAGAGLALGLAGGGGDDDSPSTEPSVPIGANPDPDPDPGSGETVDPVPAESSRTVDTTLVAGPLVSGHGLSVEFFDDQGNLLGTSEVDVTGQASLDIGDYVGVVIVRSVDTDAGVDYLDEATGEAIDLTSVLYAVGVATEGDDAVSLNINPVSSVAYAKAIELAGSDPLNGGNSLDAETVQAANDAVASAFNLTDLHSVEIVTVNGDTSYDGVDGISAGEHYGEVLATLSGMDANAGGDLQATIDTLSAGLVITADGQSAAFDSEVVRLINEGSATADAVTGLQTEGSITTNVPEDGPKIVIDEIGASNAIDASYSGGVVVVSGTAAGAEGQILVLQVGDNASYSSKVDTDGSWSIDVPVARLDGEVAFKASVSDADGNQAEVVKLVAVSLSSSEITIDPIGAYDEAYQSNVLDAAEVAEGVTVSGSAIGKEGSTVELSVEGETIGSAVVGPDGLWVASNVNVGADERSLEVLAQVSDAAGNQEQTSTVVRVNVDTVEISIDPIGDFDQLAGDYVIDTIALTEGMTISGQAAGAEGQTLSLFVNGDGAGTAQVAVDGSWSVQNADVGLVSGTLTVTARVTDEAGFESDAGTSVRLDLNPLVIGALGENGHIDARDYLDGTIISGLALGSEGETVYLFADGLAVGTAVVEADGAWSVEGVDLGSENRSLTLTANLTDSEGETFNAAAFVNVDVPRVSVYINSIGDDDSLESINDASDVTISGLSSEAEGLTVAVVVGGVTIGTAEIGEDGYWSVENVDLSDAAGTRTVTAEVVDVLGNAWSGTRTVKVDLVLQVEIDTISEDNRVDAVEARVGLTVSGRAAGGEGQTLELASGDTVLGTTVITGDGSWSIDSVVFEGFAGAFHEVTASVTDASGGRSDGELEVYVDTRLLTIEPIGLSNNNSGREVDGSDTGAVTMGGLVVGAEGQTLELFVNGVLAGTAQVGNGSRWMIEGVDLGAEAGERQVTVNVTDNTRTELSANALVSVIENASPLTVYVYGDGDRFGEIDTLEETANVTISGNGPAGQELEVFVDWVPLGTVIADAQDGSWSIEGVDLGPQDGERTIRVEVDDELGNRWSSSRVIELDIDLVTVEINPVSEDNKIDAAEAREGVTVSGRATGAEAQTLELAFGETVLTAQVASDGSWSVDGVVLEGLPVGDWGTEVAASVTDASGNRSDSEVEIFVDTQLITIEPIGLSNSNDEQEVDVSDTGSVTMGGLVVGAEGQRLQLFVDGMLAGTTEAGSDNHWRLEGVDLGTDPGERQVSVKITDNSGTALNAEASVNIIDGASPVSVLIYGDGDRLGEINSIEEASNATISGSGLAGLQVEVFVDNELEGAVTADPQSGNWSLENVDLGSQDGERAIRLEVTDEMGNRWSSSQIIELDIDLLTIEIDPVSEDNAVDAAEARDGVTISGRADGAEGQLLELASGGSDLGSVDVASDGSWSIDRVSLEGLSVGDQGLEVTASVIDVSGARSDAEVAILVDTQLITIDPIGLSSSDSLVVDAIDTGSVTMTGLVVGAVNQTLEVRVDGQLAGATVVGAGFRWTVEDIDLGADPGERTVTVNVTDNSDEPLSTTATVEVVDGASPVSFYVYGGDDRYDEIDSIDEAANATVSGGGLAGLSLQVFVNEEPRGTTVANSQNGNWSIKGVDLGPQDGIRTVRVEVTDELGNRWSSSRDIELDIDNAAATGTVDTGIDLSDAELVIDNIGENGRVDARDIVNGATISGLAFGSEGQTVKLLVDGASVGTAVVNSFARWSIDDVNLGSENRSFELTASVTNPEGETFNESRTVNVEVPPVSIFVSPIGENNSLNTINAASEATISGLSSEAEGLTVEILVDGQPLGISVVGEDGQWSVGNVDLSDVAGIRTVTAQVADVLGNEWSSEREVEVDLVLQVRIDPVSDDNQIDALEAREGVTVSGRAAGAEGQMLTLALGDKELETVEVGSDGNWSVAGVVLEGYSGASRELKASVTTANGDSAVADMTVRVDSRLITIEPIGLSNNNGEREVDSTDAGDVTMGGLVVGAAGQTLQLIVNGESTYDTLIGDDSRWMKDGIDLGDDPGERQVIVKVTDTSGVEHSANTQVSVIDNASPLSVYVYGDGDPLEKIDSIEETANATISGSGLTGQELEVFVDGQPVGKTVANGQNGSWSIEGVDLGPEDGERTILVEVSDELGNRWSSSQTIELDIDVLTIEIDPVSEDNRFGPNELYGSEGTVVVSGRAIGAYGKTVLLAVGETKYPTTMVDDKGNWSVDFVSFEGYSGKSVEVTATIVEQAAGGRSDAAVLVFVDSPNPPPPQPGAVDPEAMAFMVDDELAVNPDGVLGFLSADEGLLIVGRDDMLVEGMATPSKLIEPLDADIAAALFDHEPTSMLAFDDVDDVDDVGFDLNAFVGSIDDIPLVIADYH